jgi:hypothetical protein
MTIKFRIARAIQTAFSVLRGYHYPQEEHYNELKAKFYSPQRIIYIGNYDVDRKNYASDYRIGMRGYRHSINQAKASLLKSI